MEPISKDMQQTESDLNFVDSKFQEYVISQNLVSEYGWKARFDHKPKAKCEAFKYPRIRQALEMIPMSWNYMSKCYIKKRFREKSMPFIDPLDPIDWKPIYGVPMGGMGSGAIARGFRGEFCRASIVPGVYNFDVNPADQVSPVIPHDYMESCLPVCVFQWSVVSFETSTVEEPLEVTITLTWRGPRHALRHPHPHAGKALHHTMAAQEQHSSIKWEPYGTRTQPRELSLSTPGHSLHACLMETFVGVDIPCCYGISVRQTDEVRGFTCPGVNIDSDVGTPWSPMMKANGDTAVRDITEAPSGVQFWNTLMSSAAELHSSLGYASPKQTKPYKKISSAPQTNVASDDNCYGKDRLVMAVSAQCSLGPAKQPQVAHLEFHVAWHSPRVHFRAAEVAYQRRYARYFPNLGAQGATDLLQHAAECWTEWDDKIHQWQKPILDDTKLPNWYKSAIFNELYFLTDGGTVWLDPLTPVPLTKDSQFQTSELSRSTDVLPLDLVRSGVPTIQLDPLNFTGRFSSASDTDPAEKLKRRLWEERRKIGVEFGLFAYLEVFCGRVVPFVFGSDYVFKPEGENEISMVMISTSRPQMTVAQQLKELNRRS